VVLSAAVAIACWIRAAGIASTRVALRAEENHSCMKKFASPFVNYQNSADLLRSYVQRRQFQVAAQSAGPLHFQTRWATHDELGSH
jgi:hypothetical protein